MMSSFIKLLCGFEPQLECSVQGYSEEEISKIERLYDIQISDQLKAFLLEIGRSSAGLFGDDPIILYRSTWDVRTQLIVQLNFIDEMQEAGNYAHLEHKPFVFAIENETQYFYLRTTSDDPNRVYHFDEDTGVSSSTPDTLVSYLSRLIGDANLVPCQGELIRV